MYRSVIGASLALALFVGSVTAAELKSGPQAGTALTPFHPFNVFNAEKADLCGKKNCLV